jgi:type I restriction enzyme S subunit
VKPLPVGWSWVTLDDLQADEPAAITDGPFGSNLTSAHYRDSGPRVVRLQNIGDGVFHDARAHIALGHFEQLRRHEVKPGDLLVASLGERLPRACLTPATLGPAIVKADCIRVRLHDRVEPRWVLYAMQTSAVRAYAADQLHGVGRPRLGLKVIRSLPIPLPPLDEQRRIVDVLEDHLSRLDAASRGLASVGTRLAGLLRATRHTASTSGAHETVPLASLVSRIEAGRSFGSTARAADEGEWGIVKVSAMTWGTFNETENKVVLDPSRVDERFEIRPGDLLVSRANTSAYVGATVLVGSCRPRLLLSDKSLRLLPHEGVDPRYLRAVLQAPAARNQMSDLATGTKDSMRNISQAALLSIQLPKATPDQQAEVVRKVAAVEEQVGRLRVEIERAQARHLGLRRSLLDAAFAGRL